MALQSCLHPQSRRICYRIRQKTTCHSVKNLRCLAWTKQVGRSVKWALESTTMNKASGSDGIPVELFQILKLMLWKCYTQHVSKFGKLSNGHRTGKGQFSFQSQRKAMPKNVQNTTELYSLQMPRRLCSKPFKLGFSSMWTRKFQKYELDWGKAEETDQIANIPWIIEKAREFQKSIYFCFINYTKAFDCVNCNKLWKILK